MSLLSKIFLRYEVSNSWGIRHCLGQDLWDPENDAIKSKTKLSTQFDLYSLQLPKEDKRTETGEVIGNVAYSQPHNVQKNRPELGTQSDTFENPYVRTYPQPQPPQIPPGYQQGYFGRRKRAAEDFSFGIHRIMSTGKSGRTIPFADKNQVFLWCFSISGTLAPPMLGANDTMDVIFATHWIYPSRTPVLQPNDQKCISSGLENRPGRTRSESKSYFQTLAHLWMEFLQI